MKTILTVKLIVIAAFLGLSLPLQAQAEAGEEDRVVAHVEGMVCDFCAQGLLKALGREERVADVIVDLDASTLTVVLKDGQSLPNEELNRIISDNGFTVSRIDRKGA